MSNLSQHNPGPRPSGPPCAHILCTNLMRLICFRLASPETSSIGSSVHSNGSVLKPLSKPPTAPPLGPAQGGGVGSGGASIGSGSNSTVSLAHRAIESFNNKVQSLSTKLPKKAWQDDVTSDDDGELHCDCERRSIIDACCPLSTLHLDWGRKKSDSYIL